MSIESNQTTIDDIDNIDGDFDDEIHLSEFINENAVNEPDNIVDLYIKHMSSNYEHKPSSNKNSIDKISNKLGMMDSPQYHNRSPKPSYIDYIDDDYITESSNKDCIDIEKILDNIGDRADNIYDCVKSTDQVINEMYEKQILMEDMIDRLTTTARITDTYISKLVKSNKRLIKENALIHQKFDTLSILLKKILEDTRAIRYKDVNDE